MHYNFNSSDAIITTNTIIYKGVTIMAFCKNCGNQVPSDSAFCPACGTPVDDAQQASSQQGYAQGYQQNDFQQNSFQQNSYQQNNYQQTGYQQQPYQTYQQPVQPGVVPGSERGLAWLAYILITPVFLVPLFVKKRSEYCKFHVKQGATLWAVSVAYFIFLQILLAIINAAAPGRWVGVYYPVYQTSALYNVFAVILWLGFTALGVFAVIGIVNAATGKQKELPLFSKIPWIGMLLDKIYNSLNS